MVNQPESRSCGGRGVRHLLVALALLVAGGCASAGRLPGPHVIRTWPPEPMRPRIALLGEFRAPGDLGIEPGGLRQALDFIVGTTEQSLRRPHGIAVAGDAPGTGPGGTHGPALIAVTDTEAGTVHRYDLVAGEHRLITELGDGHRLGSPVGVAFDDRGRLYVSDSANALVVRYEERGEFDRVVARGLARPSGLAVDSARGILYAADTGEHTVRRFDLDGSPRDAIRIPFHYPTHLALDAAGRLLVSDSMNFRAVLLTAEGELLAAVGRPGDSSGDLQRPKGVGVDSDGHLYVVDALFDNVQIFDTHGQLLLAVGSAGDAPGEFALPAGLAIDARDRIYVADAFNGRVQVFQYLKLEAETDMKENER